MDNDHTISIRDTLLRLSGHDSAATFKAVVQDLKRELLSAKVVNISNCEIKGSRIEALARALKDAPQPRPLTNLCIAGNDIGDEEFQVLARAMKSARLICFKVLDLRGNRIGEAGTEVLGRNLEFLPALECLKLQHNPIGTEGLKALANSFDLGHAPELRDLSIGHVSMARESSERRKEGTRQLAKTFESGRLAKLEILDLWRFGDEGVHDLMGAFQSVSVKAHLKSLFLVRNSIGEEGATQITRALKCHAFSSLRKLFLNGNENIGDRGILELAEAFKSDSMDKLEYLSLTCTSMGDEGMTTMAKLLKEGHLPSLQHLDLTNNSVTETSPIAFLAAYVENRLLVAEVNLDWPDQAWRNSADWHRISNQKVASSLRVLQSSQKEQAIHGKVFLCGEGCAGKSRLRKSLYRNRTTNVLMGEKIPKKQKQTKGIEISHIGNKNVKLALWDLAGQSEYQVLHSAFLPDLAFADGQATLFVIVCRLNFDIEGRKATRKERVADAKEELLYWLRYITSSSVKRMGSLKRHVIVVLNSYEITNQETDEYTRFWTSVLDGHRQKFGDFLEIWPSPFVLDVRISKEVENLKNHLLEKAQNMLKGRKVPKICKEIREKARKLSEDRSHAHFPVMNWQIFSGSDFLHDLVPYVNEKSLHAAVEYLHEAGHLIYFRKGSLNLQESELGKESIVVLDPEWFCQDIVGNLLFTQTRHDQVPLRRRLQGDGSISKDELLSHMPKVPSAGLGSRVKNESIVLALLHRLGLVYDLGQDKFFMPALFENDNMMGAAAGWKHTVAGQWVMGISLLLKESEITILPVAILQRFQVELAQSKVLTDFDAGLSNVMLKMDLTDFAAGLSHVTFKMDCMYVLVQFSEDGRKINARDRVGIRVDILVKPLQSRDDEDRGDLGLTPKERKERQVNLAQVIALKLEEISKSCCPGVQFVRKVIKPWMTEFNDGMERRDVSKSIQEVREYVQERGLGKSFSNWQVGHGTELVQADELLCRKDLSDLCFVTEMKNEFIQEAAQQLGVQLGEPVLGVPLLSSGLNLDASSQVPPSDRFIRREFDMLHQHIDDGNTRVREHLDLRHRELLSMMKELTGKFDKAFKHHQELLHQVHSLEMFTIAEKSSSVPRFVFPLRNDRNGSKWKLGQVISGKFRDTYKLHFLCEAHHKNRSLHEVDKQEGIDMTHWNDWVQKLAPCLVWTLKIAFIASKVAANAVLPGVSMLFPSELTFQSAMADAQFSASTAALLKSTWSSLEKETHDQDANPNGAPGWSGSSSTGEDEREVRGKARAALKELLEKFGPVDRQQKLGLTRVALEDSHGNFNNVAWICEPCLTVFKKRRQVKVID